MLAIPNIHTHTIAQNPAPVDIYDSQGQRAMASGARICPTKTDVMKPPSLFPSVHRMTVGGAQWTREHRAAAECLESGQ